MAARHGRSSHPTEALIAAIRNGSPLTGPRPAWVTVFNTSFGPNSPLASSEDSVVRLMAEQCGRLRSAFPTRLSGERSMWPAMATFLSVAGIPAAVFGAFGRATHETRVSRQLLTRSRQLTWAATWFLAAR